MNPTSVAAVAVSTLWALSVNLEGWRYLRRLDESLGQVAPNTGYFSIGLMQGVTMRSIIRSATTTKILACVLAGVNSAYLFRGDLLAPKFMAAGLLLFVVVLLFVAQYRQRQRGGEEDREPQSEQGLWGTWMNPMLLAMILVSVLGATA